MSKPQNPYNNNEHTPRQRPPLTQEQAVARARHRKAMQAKRRRRRRLKLLALGLCLLGMLLAVLVWVTTPGGVDRPESSSVPASSAAESMPEATPVPESEPPVSSVPEKVALWADDPEAEWKLRLVNASNPLPEGYAPELRSLPNGKEFDARAFDALEQMLADGNAQGLQLMVCSAYRSIERQDYLFNEMLQDYISRGYSEEEAYRITSTIRTPHGCSEHSSGLAADIVAVHYQMLDDGFAETAEAKWLAANAPEYGFILRYPKGKEDVTGIIFEPWHFRYVGTEYARAITDSGLCFEEWIAANG